MIDFDKMDTSKKCIMIEKTKTSSKQSSKLGRKPLDEDKKSNSKISIYLTASQKDEITKKAHKNFMNVSDFIKKIVMEY